MERPLKMKCEGGLPRKAASWSFLRKCFHQIQISCSIYLKSKFSTFLYIGADEQLLVWSGHEEISTGVESENQVERKKIKVRGRLDALSEGHGPTDAAFPSADQAALFRNRLLRRVKLWIFVEFSSVVHHLILIALCFVAIDKFTADPVFTSICYRSPTRVPLLFGLWGGKITVAWSSCEQLVSFPIKSGASWFDMWDVLVVFTELNENPDKLCQRVVSSAKPVDTNTVWNSDESVASLRRQKFLSKKTEELKNSYATDELGRFFCNWTDWCCWWTKPLLFLFLSQAYFWADT